MKSMYVLRAAGLAIVGVLLTGGNCSTEPTSINNVLISPGRVEIRRGEAQEFTASGGYDYAWSLEGGNAVDEWGWLSPTRGPRTVYTATRNGTDASNGTIRVLTVTSYIEGSGSSDSQASSNAPVTTTTYTKTAEAFIVHKPGSVSVSPASAEVAQFKSQPFTAGGGNGDYAWRLDNGAIGTLSSAVGASVTYTSLASGGTNGVLQTLAVTSEGTTVYATIIHRN
jgi:hypothetical protein